MTHEQNLEEKRASMQAGLVNPDASPRYVVGAEEERVAQLVDETYRDPYAHSRPLIRLGRGILSRTGLYTPKGPQLVERPWLEASQEQSTANIKGELAMARETLGRHAQGVDDVAIDSALKLDSDESIVPPYLRYLYHEAQMTSGEDFTFVKWLTHHASDEQLLNVLQWHDHYLKELNEAPEFIRRVEQLKQDYVSGLAKAKEAGLIHPSFLGKPDIIRDIPITHMSPLSPSYATTKAIFLEAMRGIQTRPDVEDFTIFHELTHSESGLSFEFDEGNVEKIARIIYQQERGEVPEPEDQSVYSPQMKTLDLMANIAPNAISTYELSRFASGPDRRSNTIDLILQFDNAVGFPLSLALVKDSIETRNTYGNRLTLSDLNNALQYIFQQKLELAATVLLANGRDHQPRSIEGFVNNAVNLQSSLGSDRIIEALSIARDCLDLQQEQHNDIP